MLATAKHGHLGLDLCLVNSGQCRGNTNAATAARWHARAIQFEGVEQLERTVNTIIGSSNSKTR